MANGDAAAADGMDVVSSSADYRILYDEENKSRDYVAGRLKKDFSNIAGGFVPIAAGGTGATTADTARTALQAVKNFNAGSNDIGLQWDGSQVNVRVDDSAWSLQRIGFQLYSGGGLIDSGGGTILTRGGAIGTGGGNCDIGNGILISPGGRNTTVASNFAAAYFNGDGTLRVSPSARRFKQNIQSLSIDIDTFKGIEAKTFRYKSAVKELGDAAPTEVGFVAEDFESAGLGQLVWRSEDGRVGGLHYEKVSVVLWSVMQQQQTQIEALTARVEALEGAQP